MKRRPLVEWGRSDEGYVTSKCERFDIVPLYMGTTRAQAYNLIDYGPDGDLYITRMSDTQRDCKDNANDVIERERRKTHGNSKASDHG